MVSLNPWWTMTQRSYHCKSKNFRCALRGARKYKSWLRLISGPQFTKQIQPNNIFVQDDGNNSTNSLGAPHCRLRRRLLLHSTAPNAAGRMTRGHARAQLHVHEESEGEDNSTEPGEHDLNKKRNIVIGNGGQISTNLEFGISDITVNVKWSFQPRWPSGNKRNQSFSVTVTFISQHKVS